MTGAVGTRRGEMLPAVAGVNLDVRDLFAGTLQVIQDLLADDYCRVRRRSTVDGRPACPPTRAHGDVRAAAIRL
jgi:hypothetical protein